MSKKINYKKLGLLLFLIGIIIFISIHNVSKKITKEDIKYIHLLIGEQSFDRSTATYEGELEFITRIQQTLNDKIALGLGQPLGETREPKDLYQIGVGECYDRSRFLEKTYKLYGFKTRHLTLFTLRHGAKILDVIFKQNHITHSTFEVKTSKGWLNVDPNINWISLDKNYKPLSYKYIGKKLRNNELVEWYEKPPQLLMHFYRQPGFCIYGLYSRHGRFYPPFNKIPDFNFRELFYNLCI